jgi:mono/diheme cytochrome c family protein
VRRGVALPLSALACGLGCAAAAACVAALACAAGLGCVTLACAAAFAQGPEVSFTAAQITKGAAIYERNCAPCHGPRMRDPQGAANLRTFPHDEKARFVVMVTKGRNNMPPWGDVLNPDDVDALWAYVIAGER